MPAQLSIDQDVAAALLNLVTVIKPYHDKFLAYAWAADAQELQPFVKYIRKRSHEKGSQWKAVELFLNDFITLTTVPGTPDYPVNVAQAVPDILDCMLQDETTIRLAVEDCVAQARNANENRVIKFLADFVRSQAKAEGKIARLETLWTTVNGDVYEWMKLGL